MFREEIPDLNVFGKIEIKDNCFIGINSIIMPNVTIGPNAVVGAGAVVTKDVPANTVVAGVPARVICSADEYKEKCIRRWRELNLKGSRKMWEKQLMEYFWGRNKNKSYGFKPCSVYTVCDIFYQLCCRVPIIVCESNYRRIISLSAFALSTYF